MFLQNRNFNKNAKNRRQNVPKPSPNRAKIDPEGFLEPILDQCFKKAGFWTPKKRPRRAQERPRDATDAPRPPPNGAQDLPKSNF